MACTNASATLGVQVSGSLTSTDCTSTDSNGTLYADFYVFTATAGHTLTVTAHSTLSYIATIQDFSSGTVLALDSTGSPAGRLHVYVRRPHIRVLPARLRLLLRRRLHHGGIPDTTPPPAVCGNSTTLCLNNSQFSVTVHWLTTAGASGSGTALPLTGDTGYFWFFDDSNVELVVKVLDGTAINGHYWVFYGSLSDVQFEIAVTDTVTGQTKTYVNQQGDLASVADTSAF